MEQKLNKRNRARKMRVLRIRKKLKGTADKPRMSVSKTNRHLYVQLIDDEKSISLGGVGTQSKANKGTNSRKCIESARQIGTQIAEIAKKANVDRVVFDRGPNQYHGIIAELADAARKAGLQF